ncbi:MAG: dTMP kinase [bacterium]
MTGAFITFEGIEGCGKTTQIKLLAEHLRKSGRTVVLTREPGGTAIGERIRSVLLDSSHDGMAPVAELLLYAAARCQHIAEIIRPALDTGKVVLCDRYADATTAYQGAARRIDPKSIGEVHRIATGGLMPDLTILLDCAPADGLGRAHARIARGEQQAHEDRFEREAMDFHERVRQGYLEIAKSEPDRVKIVEASGSIEHVSTEVIAVVDGFLKLSDIVPL